MEEQKSSNQLLDDVLSYFNGITNPIAHLFVPNALKPVLNAHDLKIWQIIKHLVKDGYLDKAEAISGDTYFYTISFNGSLFIERGGYVAMALKDANDALQAQLEINRRHTLDEHLKKSSSRLNRLTRWLAIWTCALALIEIIKLVVWLCSPNKSL